MQEGSIEVSTSKNTGAMSLEQSERAEVASSENNSKEYIEENSAATNSQGIHEEVKLLEPYAEQDIEDPSQDFDLTDKFTDKSAIDLIPYIEKYVIVQLTKNCNYVGFVHSIDPVSYSIILSVPTGPGSHRTVFIPGSSVLHIRETALEGNQPPKRRQVGVLLDEILYRKRQIMSWLKANRLPVMEDGDNLVFDVVTILPPYGQKDVCTTNTVLSLQIKGMIGRMPANYKPRY